MPRDLISAGVKVRVVFNHFPTISARMRVLADQIVARTAAKIEAGAKVRIVTQGLVDTGAMLSSVQAMRVRVLVWRVVVGQHYAVFQEFGTRFLPARPFLIPAWEAERAGFLEAMRSGLIER